MVPGTAAAGVAGQVSPRGASPGEPCLRSPHPRSRGQFGRRPGKSGTRDPRCGRPSSTGEGCERGGSPHGEREDECDVAPADPPGEPACGAAQLEDMVHVPKRRRRPILAPRGRRATGPSRL
jgi:hypothetical protein